MRILALLALILLGAQAATVRNGFARFYKIGATPVNLGYLWLDEQGSTITVSGSLTGLTASTTYSAYAHVYGDLSGSDGSALGGCLGSGTINRMFSFTTDGAGAATVGATYSTTSALTLQGGDTNGLIGRGLALHTGDIASGCTGSLFASAVIGIGSVPAADTQDAKTTLATAPMSVYARIFGNSQATYSTITGDVFFTPIPSSISRMALDGNAGTVLAYASISAVPAGPVKHGLHVHLNADTTLLNNLTSVGGHYNPGSLNHGFPDSTVRHAGDLGNMTIDGTSQSGTLSLAVDVLSIAASGSDILGRAVIFHGGTDDGSQPLGNAGARWGYGIIGISGRIAPNNDWASSSTGTSSSTAGGANPQAVAGAAGAVLAVVVAALALL